jgi:hypothetical protein
VWGCRYNPVILQVGYRYNKGRYIIELNEAKLVKRIYSDYIAGKGTTAIANALNAEGVSTRLGLTWHPPSIQKILCNYNYTGNLLLQKTFRKDHLTKRTLINNGELPKYHAMDMHEPIISLETFEAVQAENRTQNLAPRSEKGLHKPIPFQYNWVVDIDLAKYFDTVNHDKLMAMVARKIKDKRVLKLIREYLKAVVMINGVVIDTEDGCPQGGPLSLLLSNIMLDELDKELERRGHKFCRYADDCNIYVKSRKAAERTMRSVTEFLEGLLKLKVNREKSAVDRPWKRKFLGFSFYYGKEGIRIRVHQKSIKRVKEKIRNITSRSNGMSMDYRLLKLRELIFGWVNYFRIADMKALARYLDEWTRRRLRMCVRKQWKKIHTRFQNLMKLGLDRQRAWEFANTRKSYWRTSNSPILARTITNEYLKKRGYSGFVSQLA